jgi:lysozyme
MTSDDLDKLVDQLRLDEGLRLQPYKDSLGYLTIGYGHLIDPIKGGGISENVAKVMLGEDVVSTLSSLQPFAWFQSQDPVRQCALVNMAFNLGVAGLLHFPKFLMDMGNKDYASAVSELIGTPWQQETGERADRIIALIQTGVWP